MLCLMRKRILQGKAHILHCMLHSLNHIISSAAGSCHTTVSCTPQHSGATLNDLMAMQLQTVTFSFVKVSQDASSNLKVYIIVHVTLD